MTFDESLRWLYGLQVHGIKLGLENTVRLCDALGIERESGAKRKFIHVAGTNGKGSICAILAALCVAAGKRTGLYTSPHLASFRERIRLGANFVPAAHVAEGLSRIREITRDWPHTPTFFEVATVLALGWFQRQRAEWVILETGMGGRLDATNVVTPVVSVLTPVGLDHMQHLGATLPLIAAEKAGIIKPGVPVISAPQEPEVAAVFSTTAYQRGCRIKFVENPVPAKGALALKGPHQRMNAAVAFAALVTAGLRPASSQIAAAFRGVDWPGRFQLVEHGRIVLDGAHNPAAAAALVEAWRAEFADEKAALVLGMMADKDAAAVCLPLLTIAERVICTPVQNPRAFPPHALCSLVRDLSEVPAIITDSIPAALDAARASGARALIAGSLFLVGEALSHLGLLPGDFEASAQ